MERTPVDLASGSEEAVLHQPASWANNILKLEQEIERHAQAIVELKVKRNSNLPIFRLPIEVLCRIFELIRDAAWKDPYGHSTYPSNLPTMELAWLSVTNVCQHWRNAALNDPSLWTRPKLSHSKWTRVMLERSRMAGLFLSIYDERGALLKGDQLENLVSHIPHTATLTIQPRTQKGVIDGIFAKSQSLAAPMLETLEIDGTYTHPYYHVTIVGEDSRDANVRLPANAFLDAVKLRRVSLKSVDFDCNAPLLSSLHDLTLEKISPSARPTRSGFISMMGRNPGLRSLTLNDALPNSQTTGIETFNDNRQRRPLLSLDTLNVAAGVMDCEFLFNHITVSDILQTITGFLKVDQDKERQLLKFLSALDAANPLTRLGSRSRSAKIRGTIFIPSMTLPSYWDLTFSTNGRIHGSDVRHFEVLEPFKSDQSAPNMFLELKRTPSATSTTPSTNSSEGVENNFFSDYFHGLHWDNLVELDISELEAHTSSFGATLSNTFGTLPHLRAIYVGPSCAKFLIEALVMNSDQDPALFPGSIIFPGLWHIGFEDVTFDHEAVEDSVMVDTLLDCLMDRCERGVPIQSISVDSCRLFGEAYVEMLEEIVVDVDWDEEELEEADDEDEDEDEDEEEEDYYYRGRDFYDSDEDYMDSDEDSYAFY